MTLRFYTSVVKELKVKVRKFLGLIPTFLGVTEEKLVEEAFLPTPILNRVNHFFHQHIMKNNLS